jgi:anti-sigma-K factor RskA
MTDEQHHIEDLLAAYVLGAVTPVEAARVEEHLATCDACRRLEDELREVEALLPVLAGDEAPSPGLKARLMAIVQAEAQAPASSSFGGASPTADAAGTSGAAREGLRLVPPSRAPHGPDGVVRRGGPVARTLASRRVTALLALAAMAALAVLGVQLWRSSGGAQSRPTSEYAVGGTATQPAIGGSLLYYADGARIEIDLHGLKTLPARRVYEVWLIRGHYRVVIGIGTFRPEAHGTIRFTTSGENVHNYTLACLTVERAPRATRPTLPLVAMATIDH